MTAGVTTRVLVARTTVSESGYFVSRDWFRSAVSEDCDFWYIVSGRAAFRDAGREYILDSGSGIWLVPGEDCEFEVIGPGRAVCNWMHFLIFDERGKTRPPRSLRRLLPPAQHFLEPALWAAATRKICSFLNPGRGGHEDDRSVECASRLLDALICCARIEAAHGLSPAPDPVEARHRRMVSQVDQWLLERPQDFSSAADLARKAGVQKDYFSKIYKRWRGISPSQALILARVEAAKNLLRASEMNISEIADSLGYKNVFYFSNQFKRFAGQSPRAYRLSLRPS